MFKVLWQDKIRIVLITAVFASGSIWLALSLPNMYSSTAVLVPQGDSSDGGMSQIAGQLGGLASLAGINIGGSDSNKVTVAIEIMKSWEFIEDFIHQKDIEEEVLAAIGWDKARDELEIDESVFETKDPASARDSNTSKLIHSWDSYSAFMNYFSVSEDPDSGLIYVRVEYFSPRLAAEWTKKLVDAINERMRIRDEKNAMDRIAFLKTQLASTENKEIQNILYQLIEEQTKSLMLTQIDGGYTFQMVSEPRPAEKKSSPQRAFICILLTVFGGCFAIMVSILRYWWSNQNQETPEI